MYGKQKGESIYVDVGTYLTFYSNPNQIRCQKGF